MITYYGCENILVPQIPNCKESFPPKTLVRSEFSPNKFKIFYTITL